MEPLLLSLSQASLKKHVLRPTLTVMQSVGIDIKTLPTNADTYLMLTYTLPKWLLHQDNLLALAALSGGGNTHYFRVFVMFITLLLAVLLSAGVLMPAQLRLQLYKIKATTMSVNAKEQTLFGNRANALVERQAPRMRPILQAQRRLDIDVQSKYRHVIQEFVDLRYDIIKHRRINNYNRIQAHNAYETIEWFASNQSLGFLWLLITCDRIDLDIKMDDKGNVWMYHSPSEPKALEWILSKMDPNRVRLEDVLEWVALVVSHYPKHILMINIENQGVPATRVLQAFQTVGLQHKMYSHTSKTKVLPKVKTMVQSGKNLMVFIDKHNHELSELHHTWDYYNENDYHCSDVKECNKELHINRPRTDHGVRKGIHPVTEFKEDNAFANYIGVPIPMSSRHQQEFDIVRRYELANNGKFNPWNIANSTVRAVGINRDFVRIDTDVWQNLLQNAALAKTPVTSQINALRSKLSAIQRMYTNEVYVAELVQSILDKSPLTQFIVMHTVQRYVDSKTSNTPNHFFKTEYEKRLGGYLPLIPVALFLELCVIVYNSRFKQNKN